jgi:hypothetical protein
LRRACKRDDFFFIYRFFTVLEMGVRDIYNRLLDDLTAKKLNTVNVTHSILALFH